MTDAIMDSKFRNNSFHIYIYPPPPSLHCHVSKFMEKYSRMKVSAKQLFNFLSHLWSVFPWEFEVRRKLKFKQSNIFTLSPQQSGNALSNTSSYSLYPSKPWHLSVHPSAIFSHTSEWTESSTSNTTLRNLLQYVEKQTRVFSPKTISEFSVSYFWWITWICKEVYYRQKRSGYFFTISTLMITKQRIYQLHPPLVLKTKSIICVFSIFEKHYQRAIQETYDPWDIWSEWWHDLTHPQSPWQFL